METPKHLLAEKIARRKAKVGVIGLGYVGLPFALETVKAGFATQGIDLNPQRVKAVLEGESYIEDIPAADLRSALSTGLLDATDNYERIGELDVIVIAVPTPLDTRLTPDLTYIRRATEGIAAHLRPGQLISLESTTYPGTTDEVMLPILEQSGLVVERDFFLAHSPERVDPGNPKWHTHNTPKVVGGVGPHSTEVATAFYSQVVETVVPVQSARVAEMTKIFENTFRAVNIGLVNEFLLLADRMGINFWEVLDAAFTKPFGIMPFYPGPGVGGHCVPIDPHYLEWKAREYNFPTRFIRTAGEINRQMPPFVHAKIWRRLNAVGKAPSRSRILILGVAYKPNVGDLRESPALEIIRLLQESGVDVVYHDPFVPHLVANGQTVENVPLTAETLQAVDLAVIITPHKGIDYRFVAQHAPQVLDTRNVTAPFRAEFDNIFLL